MKHVPTCFISYDTVKSHGPYTIQDMLEKIGRFGPRELEFGAIDPEMVLVWNLGWRSAQPLVLAKPSLGRSKEGQVCSLSLRGPKSP